MAIMKKSLFLSLFLLGLAVISLPAALILADSGKEKILISEEVLSGDPAEAEGIVLRIPSQWERQLLWDTEYIIGSGKETESRFTFSSKQISWKAPEMRVQVGLGFFLNSDFSATYEAGSTSFDWGYGYHEIISGVAERTKSGEANTEIVRFGDYSPNHPLTFEMLGTNVSYEGDYLKNCDYLSNYFHIQAAEDRAEVTVEKNAQGDIINVIFRHLNSDDAVVILNSAVDEGEGIYFVYCLLNAETNEYADRGQNSGIFYFPYERQESGFLEVDMTQVRKVQDFPGRIIPLEMLTDDAGEFLFLAAEDEEGCSLFVYRLEGEIPVLTCQIPVKTGHASACSMSLEAGGILLTWNDNSFSFVAEEKGRYREWCSGTFPESSIPFFREHVCIFDGERLALAAYESWYGTNVLLTVYGEQGQTYSGRYVHSGNDDRDAGYDERSRIVPQGARSGRPGGGWSWGTGDEEPVKPLEIFRQSGQSPSSED